MDSGPVLLIYGRTNHAMCHRALELTHTNGISVETVDVGRCAHCYDELVTRLTSKAGADGPVDALQLAPPLPQVWARSRPKPCETDRAAGGADSGYDRYVGGFPELEDWLREQPRYLPPHH